MQISHDSTYAHARLDPQPSHRVVVSHERWWILANAGMAIAILALSYVLEYSDQSWAAIGCLLLLNPIANGLQCLLSLAILGLNPGRIHVRWGWAVGAAVGIPVLGVAMNAILFITTIHAHGC